MNQYKFTIPQGVKVLSAMEMNSIPFNAPHTPVAAKKAPLTQAPRVPQRKKADGKAMPSALKNILGQ